MERAKKDTRIVRVKRGKAGLGFSLKGGKEHGIPILVCDVERKGATDGVLSLGDEILSVNGRSLLGFNHAQAVEVLTSCGPDVTLCVRPNHTYRDVFADNDSRQPKSPQPRFPTVDAPEGPEPSNDKPLPQGWSCKVDHRSGRPYYENHLTQTTTWSDPCGMKSLECRYFDWNKLPAGWEKLTDEHGNMFYVNHDTQTSSWDHPRGMRQLRQLAVLKEAIERLYTRTEAMEASKDGKRRAVMEKDRLIAEASEEVLSQQRSEWEEDIMVLNEEIEDLQQSISALRSRMDSLAGIVKQAVFEDVGEMSETECAADLAAKLMHETSACYALEDEIHQCVKELDVCIKRPNSTSTPLSYLLQMPPLKTKDQIAHSKKCVHLLCDQLTPKTNCEMRLELLLQGQRKRQLTVLCRQLVSFSLEVQQCLESQEILDKLMSLDFACLHSGDCLEQEFRAQVDLWIQTIQLP